jgi:hypothetical protein
MRAGQVIALPPCLQAFEHDRLTGAGPNEVVGALTPAERCVTRRGAPICACGALFLLWVN